MYLTYFVWLQAKWYNHATLRHTFVAPDGRVTTQRQAEKGFVQKLSCRGNVFPRFIYIVFFPMFLSPADY